MNTNSETGLQTSSLNSYLDYLAHDGSEIRLLTMMKGGGLCHCKLPPGKISSPVSPGRVEEIWYVLEGEGEVWRKNQVAEEIVKVSVETILTIPTSAEFQFRNTGSGSLCILIDTMPLSPLGLFY